MMQMISLAMTKPSEEEECENERENRRENWEI